MHYSILSTMRTVTTVIQTAAFMILSITSVVRADEKSSRLSTALTSTTISGGDSPSIPDADPTVRPVDGDGGIAGASPVIGDLQFPPNQFDGFQLENNVNAVPEPSAVALLALGVVYMARRGRECKSAD